MLEVWQKKWEEKLNQEKQKENQAEVILYDTRELPGIALVKISTGQIFMGKGNILNYIDILK